jgi:predicted dehydrogenase
MKKVRWGVLSTANIGVSKVIPAMQRSENCEIVAIASRDGKKAQDAAGQLNIPRSYNSYEQLLADPDIEAIYNPLPNHLHVPWSIKSLEFGKHVLCEKPIGMNVDEAVKLLDTAKKYPTLKVMEAFMYRHHPQWKKTWQLVNDGKIGQLQMIHSFFSYYNNDPRNIRNISDIGGGGLMDIGCYCISLSRYIYNSEPRKVSGIIRYDTQFKTDRLTSGILDFGTGMASFTCSTQLAPYQRVNIFGTEGQIEIEIPFNAPSDQLCKIWYHHRNKTEEIFFEICNQYTIQGDLFSQAIISNTEVPTPLEDAVANMRVIEAIVQSSENGNWVEIS